MKTLTYKERDLKKIRIEIGFQGENNRKKIQIDCSETFAEYPNAEISMKVQAPKGGIYPATVTREENLVSWVIRDCDVANKGDGEFQITFTEGQGIAKSVTGKFHVERSLIGSGTAPSGVQDWLDGAQKVLEDLEEAEVNQPCIGINGNWYVYNVESGEYVDTGVKAQGEDGDPGQPGQDATPDLITVPYEDLTFPVAAGTQCYHDGKLYEANQAIQTSEQWTAAHWTETTVEEQLTRVKSALTSIKKTPFQLAMGFDKGYISGTSPFAVERGSNKDRAIFAWLRCGKNTKVSVDTTKIIGFCVYKYSITTGEYIEKLGNVGTNTSDITVADECIILIYAKTNYDDVSDHINDVNNAVYINYAEPSTITQEYTCAFEFGSMDTATGDTSGSSANRLRSVSWVLVGAGTRIFLEDTHAKINVLMYDMTENKGYIGAGGAFTNPVFVLSRDAYIKLYASTWRDNSFSSAAELKPKIIFSEPSDFHVPDYYTTGSFIQEKRDRIIGHLNDCSYSGLNFFFITDVHWDSNNRMSPSLLHYLREKTGVCDLIFNGDAITSYDTRVMAIQKYGDFRKAFKEWIGWHWMPVIGNHEFNNPNATPGSTAQLTPSEVFGMVLAENDRIINRIDKYSYYIDFTAVKIRIFFVGADYQSLIPSETRTAVAAAISATPSDYKILVCSHIGLTGKGTTGEVETTLQPIVDALDTIHGRVIAVLTGHRHADGYLLTEAGVNIIATTCDATTEGGGLTRTRGTTGESAFECVQIDLTNSKIYMTRIGAGSNRSYDICR